MDTWMNADSHNVVVLHNKVVFQCLRCLCFFFFKGKAPVQTLNMEAQFYDII